jgi:choline transporter-like protein 2/4/5
MTIVIIIMWVACAVGMIYLVSSAPYVYNADVFTSITNYQDSSLMRFYYFVFGTLWCNALVQAVTTFVIASACCMWYYSHGPGQDLHFPILRSYGRVFRYHLGSLAFGSLILAIVQFLQLVVELFKKQAEASGADQSKIMEYIVNCLRCCLACV